MTRPTRKYSSSPALPGTYTSMICASIPKTPLHHSRRASRLWQRLVADISMIGCTTESQALDIHPLHRALPIYQSHLLCILARLDARNVGSILSLDASWRAAGHEDSSNTNMDIIVHPCQLTVSSSPIPSDKININASLFFR